MTKLFFCDECGKSYKNSRSLSSHKYSYHTKKRHHSSIHSISSISDKTSEFDWSTGRINEFNSHHTVNDLEGKIFELENESKKIKNLLENVEISVRELENLAMMNLNAPDTCTE